MDRRDFLGALAAVGLIPKSWAVEDAPTVEVDDFDGWDDDFDDVAFDYEPLPPPEPPPPPPPIRSEGPNAVIVDGVELENCSVGWERDMMEVASMDSYRQFIPGGMTIEVTTFDERAGKLVPLFCEARELSLAYRQDGWLHHGWTAYARQWDTTIYYDRAKPGYRFSLSVRRAA